MKRTDFLKVVSAGAAALVVGMPFVSKASTVAVNWQIDDYSYTGGSSTIYISFDGPNGQLASWTNGSSNTGSFNIDSSDSFSVTIYNYGSINPAYTTCAYPGYYDEKQPYSSSSVTYSPIHASSSSANLFINVSDYI